MPKITYEIRNFKDGQLDEVLIYAEGVCIFHMESMSDQHWWMAISPPGKEDIHINLHTLKAKIYANVEDENKIHNPN